jgi:hypothetical protein
MAASDHIQPEQLKMFMSPREIREDGYGLPEAGDEYRYQRKLGRANDPALEQVPGDRGGTLYDSVGKDGVKLPLRLVTSESERVLGNGHHRFVSQEQQDPDRLMPVLHHADKEDAVLSGARQELSVERAASRRRVLTPKAAKEEALRQYRV